jgi:L-ascorbate metabolism protein UlaG (beta-lactamase superfamily)
MNINRFIGILFKERKRAADHSIAVRIFIFAAYHVYTMLIAAGIILLLMAAILVFINRAPFGAMPSGGSLKKIQESRHFRDGRFQNLSHTPALTEGASFFKVFKEFFFNNNKQKTPPAPLPSKKTDLLQLDTDKNILVWFGHSSYFMQVDGKKILVDPVFSGHASPFRFTTKSFKGSDIYTVADLPRIDYLFLTHDHWDHLDYKTLLQLKTKVDKIITGLGVAAHLSFWGFEKEIMEEKDWHEQIYLDEGFTVNTVPARHFSGRGFKRNGSLWSSFVFTTPHKKIFIGGDSGYDRHFSETGNQFGPFDLVILEDGQYDKNWKYIHMTPEETVQAAIDLQAKKLLPVHWAKFNLSVHNWDEPIIRIKKEARLRNMKLVHPMIGESVELDHDQSFSNWWEGIH